MSDFEDDDKDGQERIKDAFSFLLVGGTDQVMKDVGSRIEAMEDQERIFDQLSNWAYADFGTNEIKRAKLIKQIQGAGYDEPYARNITKMPKSLTEELLSKFMLERSRGSFREDGKSDALVEAKLREFFDLPAPKSDFKLDGADEAGLGGPEA